MSVVATEKLFNVTPPSNVLEPLNVTALIFPLALFWMVSPKLLFGTLSEITPLKASTLLVTLIVRLAVKLADPERVRVPPPLMETILSIMAILILVLQSQPIAG